MNRGGSGASQTLSGGRAGAPGGSRWPFPASEAICYRYAEDLLTTVVVKSKLRTKTSQENSLVSKDVADCIMQNAHSPSPPSRQASTLSFPQQQREPTCCPLLLSGLWGKPGAAGCCGSDAGQLCRAGQKG